MAEVHIPSSTSEQTRVYAKQMNITHPVNTAKLSYLPKDKRRVGVREYYKWTKNNSVRDQLTAKHLILSRSKTTPWIDVYQTHAGIRVGRLPDKKYRKHVIFKAPHKIMDYSMSALDQSRLPNLEKTENTKDHVKEILNKTTSFFTYHYKFLDSYKLRQVEQKRFNQVVEKVKNTKTYLDTFYPTKVKIIKRKTSQQQSIPKDYIKGFLSRLKTSYFYNSDPTANLRSSLQTVPVYVIVHNDNMVHLRITDDELRTLSIPTNNLDRGYRTANKLRYYAKADGKFIPTRLPPLAFREEQRWRNFLNRTTKTPGTVKDAINNVCFSDPTSPTRIAGGRSDKGIGLFFLSSNAAEAFREDMLSRHY
jgi:hypothetical protein